MSSTLYNQYGERIEKEQQATSDNNNPFGLSTMDYFKLKAQLHQKISKVRAKVKRIAKNGRNAEQKYSYAEAADIYNEVREIMDAEKLGFDSDLVEESIFKHEGGRAPISKVVMRFTWIDLETGYHEQNTWMGTGQDYGDKGIYKAYTGTTKYALVNKLLIPTGDDPAAGVGDPEKEESKPNVEDWNNQPNNSQKSGNSGNGSSGGRKGGNSNAKQQNGGKGRGADKKPPESKPEASESTNPKVIDDGDVPATKENIENFKGLVNDYLEMCNNKTDEGFKTIMDTMVNNAKWEEITQPNPDKFTKRQWSKARSVILGMIKRKNEELEGASNA